MPRRRSRSIEAILKESSERIRGRLHLLHQLRGYVQEQLARYGRLATFRPLSDSLRDFDSKLAEGESLFCRAHSGAIDESDLERFIIDDYIPDLSDQISERQPSHAGWKIAKGSESFIGDADDLMNSEWDELARLVRQLQDGLRAIYPAELMLPWQSSSCEAKSQ